MSESFLAAFIWAISTFTHHFFLDGGALTNRVIYTEGDKITGVSLMQMTEELDAGPVYEQRSINMNGENTKTLSEKLTLLAGDMIESFLPSFFEGDIKAKQQDERLVTESKIIKKEDARVDWNETSEVIDSKIKAYYPWP